MQITFILPGLNMSGGTRVVAIYARLLRQLGHKVTVVAPPPKPTPLRSKVKLWLRSGLWPKQTVRSQSYFTQSDRECHVLETYRPITDSDIPDGDIVIATWWETAEWVNALSPKKGAKIYFVQHHEVFDYLPVSRCEATYRLPLHKIVVASWLKQIMETKYSDFDVDFVPNSVDKNQFWAPVRRKQAIPTVGFLYSPAEFKGIDVSIAAIELVRTRIPGLKIVSFGNALPLPSNRMPEGTEFILSPPQDQIRNIYAKCDAWLTSSRSEGFNLTAMEAMACRTPVVSTRTGWPIEAIKSRWNGWLAEVNDVEELANGVTWVLKQSDPAWATLSENAFQTLAESSWEVSAKLFEASLMKQRRTILDETTDATPNRNTSATRSA